MKTQKIINRFKVVGLDVLFVFYAILLTFSFALIFIEFITTGKDRIINFFNKRFFKTLDRISDLKKSC